MHFIWLLFSLVPFNLDQSPGFLYCFPSQWLFKSPGQFFYRMSPTFGYIYISQLQSQIGDVLYFLPYCIIRQMMSGCPIIGNAKCYHHLLMLS